jgi:membrane fusion protein (multidrug efflux system)
VVQRLPVRIALDAHELARHPLRVGVSMTARIYLDQSGDTPPTLRTATLRTAY